MALAAAHRASRRAGDDGGRAEHGAGRYGGVVMEADGEVTGFVGRGSARPSWHFIGVQVAEREAFAGLPDNEPAESVGMVYPALIRERPGSVRAMVVRRLVLGHRHAADYLATSLAFAGGAAEAPLSLPSVLAGARTTVAPSARLVRTILWDDVEVGEDASLSECVVADGVRVPPGVRWTRLAVVPAGCCAPGAGDRRAGDLLLSPLDR